MNVEYLNSVITKCNYSYEDDIDHMNEMMNEMYVKFPENKEYVLNSIGVTEDEVVGGYFDCEQFRNAFNFYLKEKAK